MFHIYPHFEFIKYNINNFLNDFHNIMYKYNKKSITINIKNIDKYTLLKKK